MCTQPLTAYHNPSGGRPIFGYEGVKNGLQEIQLPCGKCSDCCKDYYTSWATRGSRELLRWETSLFITLTYDDAHLPPNRSLCKKDIQDFIKRIKKALGSHKANPIRQIYCGEYGKHTNRPHYHVILFNCDFRDKVLWRKTDQNHAVYRSSFLTEKWGNGNAEFGYATPSTIAYLFKYILKKKTRREKLQPLVIEHEGITYEVEHEFIEASRNPGIGAHLRDARSLRKGFLTVNGQKKKLPKYYQNWLKENEPEIHEALADSKMDHMLKQKPEGEKRRKQREKAQRLLTDTKKRL